MAINIERKKEILDIVKTLGNKSLSEIAELNHIKVYIDDITDIGPISGGILKSSDGIYKIIINSKDNIRRQRFTFAHELGHFFLHKDYLEANQLIVDGDSPYLFRPANGDLYGEMPDDMRTREEEANFFAAEFLMPEEKVREIWEKVGKDKEKITEIANFFEVSISALAYRLENLNLLQYEG